MKKQNWISFQEFENKYNLIENSLNVFKATKKQHAIAFRGKRKSSQVDEYYFLRRHLFKQKVHFCAQDVYYLVSEHFSDADIARFLQNTFGGTYDGFRSYLNLSLFNSNTDTILAICPSKNHLKLFKYWWQIERRLRRRGASISKILDKRAGLV